MKTALLNLLNYVRQYPKQSVVALFLLLVFSFFYYFLIQPGLFLYSQSKELPQSLQPIISAAKRADAVRLNFEMGYLQKTIVGIRNAGSKIGILAPFPFVGGYAADVSNVTQAGFDAFDVAHSLSALISPLFPRINFNVWGTVAEGPSKISPQDIANALPKLSQELPKYKDRLISIFQKINKIDEKRYPEEFKGKPIRKYLTLVKSLSPLVISSFDDLTKALPLVPELLGANSGKNYLVIIQNDKELRPGGGLLGGYAFITMKGGDFKLVKSGDIFFLDNVVLNSRPPTPSFVSHYLGSNYLHLKDANYSADFKESAENIRKLWLSTPNSFDLEGIFVIDSEFIKALLGPLQQVDLGGGMKVDKDNVESVLNQFFSVAGNKSNSSRKYKDLTSTLLNEILKRVFAYSSYNANELFSRVGEQIRAKHILVYFTNQKIQELAEKYNVAGRVNDSQGDYLLVNQALLSQTRLSWDLETSVTKGITLGQRGENTGNLNLVITGRPIEGKENMVNDYVRVFVPKGSLLIETHGFGSEVTTQEELGKTVFSGLAKLEPGKETELSLKYNLPVGLLSGNYHLLIQKQPGTKNYHYQVSINGNSQEFDLSADKEINLNQ